MALTTGELARQSGVNLQTIRFYEREGLLPAPPRSASGYRAFPVSTVSRVRFIKRAQELGFTLSEVHGLLSLRVSKSSDRAQVRRMARARLAEIEGKIASLETMRAALTHLPATCTGHGPADECPILQAIDSQELLL